MIEEGLRNKKIIYMGTPDFAVPALEALVEEGYQVTGVVTRCDKPKGRGKSVVKTPVKEAAEKYGIPVWQPKRVRDPEFVRFLTEQKPDMIIVAAFGQIIPAEILDLPPYGCLNIHGSLLPKYRGASPIQRAVMDGEEESGVTIMRMGEGIDTGDMISRVVVPLSRDETGGSLFDKLAVAGAGLLIDTLPEVFTGRAVYEKQPEESPTPYAAMLKKQSGNLDFSLSADVLERMVRGLNPWPGAFTHLDGKTLKIWKSRAVMEDEEIKSLAFLETAESAVPGTILKTGADGIYVRCTSGILVLTEVQLEGRKRMASDAFLRGCRVSPGEILTM